MGRKAAKLAANNMINSAYYGRRASESEKHLKHIMNKLVLEGYLYLTNDKYSIVKVGKPASVIEMDHNKVTMKLSKESILQKQNDTGRIRHKSELLTSRGIDLFETLRRVRTRLAKEEGMPPYIIFSDKTLTDMCVRLPMNKQEMLKVVGVGEHKYEKYGQQFINAVKEFTHSNVETLCYEPIEKKIIPQQSITSERVKKTEFCLTQEIIKNMKPLGTVTISQFVEHLNELRSEKSMKRLSIKHLTSQLKEAGYLAEQYSQLLGRSILVASDRGLQLGLSMKKMISEKGNEYEVVMYNEEAQEYLLSLL
jgi:ATP-dependent DNA helicase RecQ